MWKKYEIKKNSQDVAAILLNNQSEISKGLEDLKHQFELIRNGIKAMKRNRSFGNNNKNRRRRTFQLDGNKDIMRHMNRLNKIADSINSDTAGEKNANIQAVKRNIVIVQDINGFKDNKKGKKKKEKILHQ